jgi:hypothetical protein
VDNGGGGAAGGGVKSHMTVAAIMSFYLAMANAYSHRHFPKVYVNAAL